MKKILFVGAEALPFAATGGLGDVLGTLPAALAAAPNTDVRVILPLYGQVGEKWRNEMKEEAVFYVKLAWRSLYCGVKSLKKDGVTYYFIDNEYYFKRDTLYGSFDDGERFAFFSMAAVECLAHIGFYPDVLHAHDWQAALSVVYLNCLYRNVAGYERIRTVFTIHNIEYQGKYGFEILGDVFSLGQEERSRMEFDGCINLMKAAIASADRVTTVSPRYAEEICDPAFAHGLHGILQEHRGKLSGILNGIDDQLYNPAVDPVIGTPFTADDVSGKYENKKALQRSLGLPARSDAPLFAVITRLVSHKGVDLIAEMADELLSHRVQLVVLGCGDGAYEHFFRDLEHRYPQKVRALITYDRDLAKRIYAAADIFLMPSRSEPCGLAQMIASRYGAIPVVRETGGLADSIKGYWVENGEQRGNGFTFANYKSRELLERSLAACTLWRKPEEREKFVKKIMQIDFSWARSARGYLDLYDGL